MKDGPGVLLKNQTPWSKQDTLSTALKQGHAKTRFQIPHLLRTALSIPGPFSTSSAKPTHLLRAPRILQGAGSILDTFADIDRDF
jgi:hypothetical protein